MQTIDFTAVLEELKQRRQKLKAEYEAELSELLAAISAVEKLASKQENQVFLFEVKRPSFERMSLGDAARECLREAGRPLSTSEIWRILSSRGAKSDAKNPTNSMYSIMLRRNDEFVRLGKKWGLRGVPSD